MVVFRFYEELNRFLPKHLRKKDIHQEVQGQDSVKKYIEDRGVPHTEVDLILVNGKSVDFSYSVRDEDRISVYPVFESFNIKDTSLVRPKPLRKVRFIADVHLGKLTVWLRILGFDVLYSNVYEDKDLIRISVEKNRILLTRDRQLLKRKILTHGYCIRSDKSIEQTREVIERFQLERDCRSFTRCVHCNFLLKKVPKSIVKKDVPPFVFDRYEEFKTCSKCKRIYWKGTHWNHMKEQILAITKGLNNPEFRI